ncbi:CLAVATA3/ESR (CLE)-related protein 10, partial [Cucurbita argyrosperma subsp. argyrosperma]
MKASLSSCTSSSATNAQLFMMISMLLLVFVNSSATRLSGYPPSTRMPDASPTTSTHPLPHRELQQLHPCDALTHENSRSLCIHLYRVYQHHLPVHVPQMLTHNGIDPRYGVEKRLVPSGPNPLHN